jgi:transposase-like protein
MTDAQSKIKAERQRLQRRIQWARQVKATAELKLRDLCRACKHDDTSTWEQSASGNESRYICDLCGAEI